jgi:DtxR family Mn-dependent transcriptional regulator
LAELRPGRKAVVAEVSDHDPKLLRYLGERGLYPKVEVEVLGVEPFQGPLRIRVEGKEQLLGREAARHVFVTEVS